MGNLANAKVTHYYNCYNGYFVGCLLLKHNHMMQPKTNPVCLHRRLPTMQTCAETATSNNYHYKRLEQPNYDRRFCYSPIINTS